MGFCSCRVQVKRSVGEPAEGSLVNGINFPDTVALAVRLWAARQM
jgi:hypothetical protein